MLAWKLKNLELQSYSCSTSGDMRGSWQSVYISALDDEHAFVSISYGEWHSDDPHDSEYIVDRQALRDIEAIFRKYRMYRWHNRKFTRMFMHDGASTGYDFDFGKEEVRFSSQLYPPAYSSKLGEIRDIVASYIEKASALPGLVTVPRSEDEKIADNRPNDGVVRLKVYEYLRDELFYRVLNGTAENFNYLDECRIYSLDTGEVIAEKQSNDNFPCLLYSNRMETLSIQLDARLAPGKYRLECGSLSCEFEIR